MMWAEGLSASLLHLLTLPLPLPPPLSLLPPLVLCGLHLPLPLTLLLSHEAPRVGVDTADSQDRADSKVPLPMDG